MKKTMLQKLLWKLTACLPLRIISDGNGPYLERYWLGSLFGWQFYIHRFVASDPDRGLHDHPWSRAFSIILSGWYWEETRAGTRKVRWFNSLTGDSFHRVVLPYRARGTLQDVLEGVPQPCWTLFFHRAENVKLWWFLRSGEPYGFGGGSHVFVPHDYAGEGKNKQWWLTAKCRGEA